MDNSSSQSILDTLRTVEFRLGLKGYNVDEVDEYLEKAAVEAESVQEQLRSLTERLRQANERIGQLEVELQRSPSDRSPATERDERESPVSDDALQRTLLLAQKFVDQTRKESEAEAAEVVSRAEERARQVLAQAEERARQLVSDSEHRLRTEVTRLEGLRTRLTADVDAMNRHLAEQRSRIRASLTEALKWIDEKLPAGVEAPDAASGAGDDDDAAESAEGERREQGAESRPAPQEGPVRPTAPGGAGGSVVGAPPAGGVGVRAGGGTSAAGGTLDRAHSPVGARLRSLGSEGDLFEH